jgi:hypothetical protein
LDRVNFGPDKLCGDKFQIMRIQIKVSDMNSSRICDWMSVRFLMIDDMDGLWACLSGWFIDDLGEIVENA